MLHRRTGGLTAQVLSLRAQVLLISHLSTAGGAQLAADVEYFCNVMSALHVMAPASLLTVQLFAAQPAEQFAEVAAVAGAEGGADAGMLRALAQMRRIRLTVAQPQAGGGAES